MASSKEAENHLQLLVIGLCIRKLPNHRPQDHEHNVHLLEIVTQRIQSTEVPKRRLQQYLETKGFLMIKYREWSEVRFIPLLETGHKFKLAILKRKKTFNCCWSQGSQTINCFIWFDDFHTKSLQKIKMHLIVTKSILTEVQKIDCFNENSSLFKLQGSELLASASSTKQATDVVDAL